MATMTIDKKACLRVSLFLITAFLMENRVTFAQSGVRTWNLSFEGKALGGELILMRTFNRSVEYVAVATSPGESPGSVVSRLADAINRSVLEDTTRVSPHKHKLWQGDFLASASGEVLTLPGQPSGYALGGTETGLCIPSPPTSLSCSAHAGTLVLEWINPPLPYDSVLAQIASMKDGYLSYQHLPGSAESFTLELAKIPSGSQDVDVRVIGFRDKIPSNAAAIHVSGFSQDELYGIPFTNNVAPNWKVWATAEKVEKSLFECIDKYSYINRCLDVEALVTKPFYQVIKASPNSSGHGIYRKFLGLTSGHTYRLTACVSTLDMDLVSTPWSFALCAAVSQSGHSGLTSEQMAGSAALPDGARGPEAGCVASFTPGRTTKGTFDLIFTGERNEQGQEVSHITVPHDANSITVWLRFSCGDPQGKVAFSGVMLEDITANPNVMPPVKVREAAYKAEERLMRGIADQFDRQRK